MGGVPLNCVQVEFDAEKKIGEEHNGKPNIQIVFLAKVNQIR